MNKQTLKQNIVEKMKSYGLECKNSENTDIIIDREFLSASWGTGTKKISYNAQIFINEKEKTIYMYEKTTETGSGLSAGGSMQTSFQSGKTLFRKVKAVQYGPDGKAVEYTLDLGIIPKTVKELSKDEGWKFKTVVNIKKSQYPKGYVSTIPLEKNVVEPKDFQPDETKFCENCGKKIFLNSKFCEYCGYSQNNNSVNESENTKTEFVVSADENGKAFDVKVKQKNKKVKSEPETEEKKKSGILQFILLILLTGFVYYIMKISILGWILGVITLVFFRVLQVKILKRGKILRVILGVILWAVVLFSLLFIISAS